MPLGPHRFNYFKKLNPNCLLIVYFLLQHWKILIASVLWDPAPPLLLATNISFVKPEFPKYLLQISWKPPPPELHVVTWNPARCLVTSKFTPATSNFEKPPLWHGNVKIHPCAMALRPNSPLSATTGSQNLASTNLHQAFSARIPSRFAG